jgi:hypothetical protein
MRNAVVAEAGPAAGERALMRAVLEDAIRCLAGERGPRHQRGALAAGAREWIEVADPRWPFSFENVCDGLGLDAATLRRRLLRDAPAATLREAPAPTLPDAQQPGGRGVRPRRETLAACDIVQMIQEGRPLRVVAQTFGISISKASILSCGLASRIKAERDGEIRRLRAEGWTHRALAVHFELSRIRIKHICQRRHSGPERRPDRGLSLPIMEGPLLARGLGHDHAGLNAEKRWAGRPSRQGESREATPV